MSRRFRRGTYSRVTLPALVAFWACSWPAARAPSDEVGQRVARIERGLLPGTRVEGRTYAPATIEDRTTLVVGGPRLTRQP